jgi:hypothetical protein
VPGLLDWSTMTHNPFMDVTAETTTLYASDHDVFLFLVADTHHIEAVWLVEGSSSPVQGQQLVEARDRMLRQSRKDIVQPSAQHRCRGQLQR